MKYRNIVFDFGNVVGQFNAPKILGHFCDSKEDYELLASVIYPNWLDLDRGIIDYEENIEECVSKVPERLAETVRTFFHEWPDQVLPVESTGRLIRELQEKNVPLYLLSNASTYFAEWAEKSDFLKGFSGIVFSAPLKLAKPDPAIYRYLFEKYSLRPEECFFIDDLPANIETGRKLGMNGIVFKGDIDEVKSAIGFSSP